MFCESSLLALMMMMSVGQSRLVVGSITGLGVRAFSKVIEKVARGIKTTDTNVEVGPLLIIRLW